jgi:hypothetical protein
VWLPAWLPKPNRISSSGQSCPDRFKLDQPSGTVSSGPRYTASNCNPKCNPALWRDPLLRRSWAGVCRSARPQVSGNRGLSPSSREIPRTTDRSGTQRARRKLLRPELGDLRVKADQSVFLGHLGRPRGCVVTLAVHHGKVPRERPTIEVRALFARFERLPPRREWLQWLQRRLLLVQHLHWHALNL